MFFQPLFPVIVLAGAALLACIVMVVRVTNRQTRVRWALRAFAALLIATAAFRPSTQTLAVSDTYNNHYNVYFVVDLTSSVAAEDWGSKQTRLDGVRADINDLLDEYAGAKFSLITFNSTSTMRVPLTPDATALASSVNTMLPEVTQYSKGSSISEPKTMLQQTLKTETDADPNKDNANIVLYFGDGEQTISTKPDSFSSLAPFVSAAKVYGYGTKQGGRMKVQNGYYISSDPNAYIQDPTTGKDALSMIDENNLQNIAKDMHGSYEHRDAAKKITPALLDDAQKRVLEKNEGANINNTIEYYWLLLIPVGLIMFIEAGALARKAKKLGVEFK